MDTRSTTGEKYSYLPLGAILSEEPAPPLLLSTASTTATGASNAGMVPASDSSEHAARTWPCPLLASTVCHAPSTDVAQDDAVKHRITPVTDGHPSCVPSSVHTTESSILRKDRDEVDGPDDNRRTDHDDHLHDGMRFAHGVSARAGGRGGYGDEQDMGAENAEDPVANSNRAAIEPHGSGRSFPARAITPRRRGRQAQKSLSKTRNATTVRETSFRCIICNRAFLSASSRQHHYSSIHSKGRPY